MRPVAYWLIGNKRGGHRLSNLSMTAFRRRFLRPQFVLASLALLVACASLQWDPLGPRRSEQIPGTERIGSAECVVCHEDVQGHQRIAAYHSDCESCHGGGSLHEETEGAAEIRYPSNEDCLGCHTVGRDSHLQWGTGEHSRAGLYCSDCHNPHDTERHHLRNYSQPGSPDMDLGSRLCVECHRTVDAQFNYPSHHPVREGGMSCMSCHDPHEDQRVAHGARNQVCASCHQDYMGPWIYEHPPVTEDCGICHSPHGAVTQNLLGTMQPVICLSCHTLNDTFHHDMMATGISGNTTISQNFPTAPGEKIKPNEAATFLRRCTDCHGAVHGSYSDAQLRY